MSYLTTNFGGSIGMMLTLDTVPAALFFMDCFKLSSFACLFWSKSGWVNVNVDYNMKGVQWSFLGYYYFEGVLY